VLLAGAILPSWQDFQPFLVTGLALGGVYALSGVGMLVLFRATGVLNLAFGAVGAFGALIAWQLINKSGWNQWLAYLACIVVSGGITLAYGMLFGPALSRREPLVKAAATLGLTLFGFAFSAFLTYQETFTIAGHPIYCEWCVGSAVVLTILFILALIRYLRPSGTSQPPPSPA